MVPVADIYYGGVRLQTHAVFHAFLQDAGYQLFILKSAHFLFQESGPIHHFKNRFVFLLNLLEKFWSEI